MKMNKRYSTYYPTQLHKPKSVLTHNYALSLSGELVPRETQVPAPAHLYVTCTWVVSAQAGSTLMFKVTPTRHGSCNTWNLTIVALRRESGQRLVGGACGSDAVIEFRLPPRQEAASITLDIRGRGDRDWQITWNSRWTGKLPGAPATSVSPKPEHSRTLHANPTGKTYSVLSGGVGKARLSYTEGKNLAVLMVTSWCTLLLSHARHI
ncbi:uncharacterized protein LOC122254081 [Penaeus japonicus]|uniref:uncharacterized protein LOC122254081 n=1 Tax=Penaeus japonicus TaxID=27405 RepID=UPI001C7109CA|nr:uncharacterized protein LOC122254081 [Penaeus japonicus]